MTHKKITAQEGYIFVRIHDNFKMSNEITLGYDYSTGVKREDKEEYYRQEVAPETEIGFEDEFKDGEWTKWTKLRN